MTIDFQYTNFKADQKLLSYISKKLGKMETFYDHIVYAIVYLKVANTEEKDNKTVEFKVNVSNQTLFVSETGQSFEASTDIAVEKLKSQLLKYKGKKS
jgi:putative sigma-54 modulation protein